MTDIRKLLNQLATEENKLRSSEFIAPCVGNTKVRTRIARMVYTFTPIPRDITGWGIFQPIDEKKAAFVEEPNLPLISQYLKNFQPLRLRLAYPLQKQSWMGFTNSV